MDEAFKQQLLDYAKRMLDAAEKGANFAAEQIPLVIQEWLRWQFAEAALYVGLWVGLLLLWLILEAISYRLATRDSRPQGDIEEIAEGYFCIAGVVGGFILFVTFFAVTVPNIVTMVKVYTAPRVMILEFARGLLK